MKKVYHLRPANTAECAYCGCDCAPDRTINSQKDLPEDGRMCLRCVRRLYGLPLFNVVPKHLAYKATPLFSGKK